MFVNNFHDGLFKSIDWKEPKYVYSVKKAFTDRLSNVQNWYFIKSRVYIISTVESLMPLCFSQGSVPLESSYVVGHVASAPKEQNLTTLFSDGESSQVWFYVEFDLRKTPCSVWFTVQLRGKNHFYQLFCGTCNLDFLLWKSRIATMYYGLFAVCAPCFLLSLQSYATFSFIIKRINVYTWHVLQI